MRKTSTLAYISLLLSALVSTSGSTSAIAQMARDVPAGCKGPCKKQYVLLANFSEHTPESYIRQILGEPREVAKGVQAQLFRYTGKDVELLTLRVLGTDELSGVAIVALTKNKKNARVPFLNMGEYNPTSRKTELFMTLDKLTLLFLKERCEGAVEDIDARYAVMWTPNCYFGRPGSYMNYSFLFEISSCKNGKGSILDAFQFSELVCPPNMQLPKAAFVTMNENAQKEASVISRFLYWGEFN
jgi:hypothetical protein